MAWFGRRRGNILKLVLLPGMDGTGELFEEFVSYLNVDNLIVSLPQTGFQDHLSLAIAIEGQLPSEDFVLLAESFSGGIVPELLKRKPTHIKGVIFVASFLSCPNKFLVSLAKRLPLKALALAPLSNLMQKYLLLGPSASNTLISKFVNVTQSISEQVLKSRLEVMCHQRLPSEKFDISVVYIQAKSDRLISSQKSRELRKIFETIKYVEIDGPHFILQAKPQESSLLVEEAIKLILNQGQY